MRAILEFNGLISATQFFVVLKAYTSQSVCVRCMHDVFVLGGSKKAMMQFGIVLGT